MQVNSWSLYSNTLYYVSPKFSGFEAGAMYSLAGDHNETTGMAKDDHFGNAFLRWDGKNVRAITGLELYHVGHEYNGTTPNKDRWSFKLAADQPLFMPDIVFIKIRQSLPTQHGMMTQRSSLIKAAKGSKLTRFISAVNTSWGMPLCWECSSS